MTAIDLAHALAAKTSRAAAHWLDELAADGLIDLLDRRNGVVTLYVHEPSACDRPSVIAADPQRDLFAEDAADGALISPLGDPRASTAETSIPPVRLPPPEDAFDGPWVGPRSPKEWRKQLRIAKRTWSQWVLDGVIRVKQVTTRRVYVARDDLANNTPNKGA